MTFGRCPVLPEINIQPPPLSEFAAKKQDGNLAGGPGQLEGGIGRLLKPAKYCKIWSRHFAESAT
jgi:hypothetical protein